MEGRYKVAFIYLSSPYSHHDAAVRAQRYRDALQTVALLMSDGRTVFSPIVHCHELALTFNLPTSFDFWRNYNLQMLQEAFLISVLCIPGWKDSKGVTEELKYARGVPMGVSYIYIENNRLLYCPEPLE